MLTITKKLDMSPHGVPQVIRVSQYDSDFTLEFKLFASGGNFAISTGTTAEIRGTKQSGTGYSASATLDTSTKVVTVAGAAQMTAVAGMNIFEIVLKKNNKEISSANFCLMVERAALDADTITDESVLKELNAIIESADTATQAAEEAEDAADRAEAAAQTLVIDSTLTQSGQVADAKATGDAIAGLENEIAQIVPGLSSEAKDALLACFEHVAWIDEHGQDYYDALESALYPDAYWDYEWYASSGALPEGMTADAYDFSTVPGALHVEKPVLDFDYIGDLRLYIECNLYAESSESSGGEQSQSNPQIVIKNKVVSDGQFKGCKVIASPSQSSTFYIGFGINGTTSIISGIKSKESHIYDISAINGVYTLNIDGNDIAITQNDNTSPYISFTGITSSANLPSNVKQIMDIKCIKYKKL